MSFNIRNSSAADGRNAWTNRRDLWTATVRAFDPDLLGVQEVLADQYEHIREVFPDYKCAGVARDDGAERGERALILYRAARFEKLDGGDFWLSRNPDAPGSRSWGAGCVRICTWVRLLDRATDHQIVHANTHFDDRSALARSESASLLRNRLAPLAANNAVVVTGDFNCCEGEDPYDRLLHREDASGEGGLLLRDAYRKIHPRVMDDEASYHGFNGTRKGKRIDWILNSSDLEPIAAHIVPGESRDGIHASDHYPVTATFRWSRARVSLNPQISHAGSASDRARLAL